MQCQTENNSCQASKQQLFHRDVRPGSAQPTPRNQAEDHRPQCRDKTQCEVTALVVNKRMLARKEIQEPLVETVSEIVVLVPMRSESRIVVLRVPLRRNADAWPVEIPRRCRIHGPKQPISHKNDREHDPDPLQRLHFKGKISKQKQERIAEADLREGILKSEIRNGMVHRAKEHA